MDTTVFLNMRKPKRKCFLTPFCSEPYSSPGPLLWLNWKPPSSVPGFTTFSILGRGGKGVQEQGLTKSRRGRAEDKKKCFLKKWGGGKISRSLSCTYNTKWRKFVLEGKSWGTWPSSPRVGVGGQWQQLPGVGCWSVKKCHDGAVRRQPLGARAQCAVTVGAVCWGVGKEVIS